VRAILVEARQRSETSDPEGLDGEADHRDFLRRLRLRLLRQGERRKETECDTDRKPDPPHAHLDGG